METYIKDTIGELDHFIGACIGRRDDLAARLAAIEAGTSMHVLDAASDYQQRAAEGRPYEDAEDAETLLSEAFRQHVR